MSKFLPVLWFSCVVWLVCGVARGGDNPGGPAGEKLGWPGTLHLLTGPDGGQWDALGAGLANYLSAAGIPTWKEVGGGGDNLRLIGEGKADLGFTLYSFMGAAGAGDHELPAVNLDNAVLLANLYPQVLYLIVRKDVAVRHNLKTLRDLLQISGELRFSTLPKGTGSESIFNLLLKNAYRTSYDQLEKQGWHIAFNSYAEITRQFLNSELDVCAYTAGPGTYLIPALEQKRLDAVILPVDEAVLDLMTHQFMTITYVIEKGDYQSVKEDVPTLGDYSSLVVQSVLPEDLVYRINQVLWTRRSDLAKISRDIEHLSPRIAVAGQSKVHPGSLKFWKEITSTSK